MEEYKINLFIQYQYIYIEGFYDSIKCCYNAFAFDLSNDYIMCNFLYLN